MLGQGGTCQRKCLPVRLGQDTGGVELPDQFVPEFARRLAKRCGRLRDGLRVLRFMAGAVGPVGALEQLQCGRSAGGHGHFSLNAVDGEKKEVGDRCTLSSRRDLPPYPRKRTGRDPSLLYAGSIALAGVRGYGLDGVPCRLHLVLLALDLVEAIFGVWADQRVMLGNGAAAVDEVGGAAAGERLVEFGHGAPVGSTCSPLCGRAWREGLAYVTSV